jgi:WD40 repeat protein
MKNIKNVVKKSCLFTFVVMFFVGNVIAMRMTPQQVERKKAAVQQVMQKNQYFIHETDNPKNGIWVDKQFVKDNCKSIKGMLEDLGEELNTISLPTSVEIIKLGFDLLQDKKDVKDLSFEQLVDVANLFNFLDVPADKLKAVLVRIKDIIDSDPNNIVSNETLNKLNPDVQRVLLTEPTINCLKYCIAQKYTKGRGKPLTGQPQMLTGAVAISPDGTKIVAGGGGELILWDISNPSNIMRHPFSGVPFGVGPVAFSPDGKYVISSSRNYLILAQTSDLTLWNISDLNNITHQRLGVVQDNVKLVTFSPDGKNVFSCGNHFTVWDISNPDNITSRRLLIDLSKGGVCSPDGRLVASGGDNVFVIKDVSGPKVIEYKPVGEINVGKIYGLAFSPDAKAVISYGDQFILWDVSDLNNIQNSILVGVLDLTKDTLGYLPHILRFSHDGKKIALSSGNKFILLDIHNSNNRVVIDKISRSILSMELSSDNKHIVTVGTITPFDTNVYLWTLLTDQEEAVLNQVKNCNADQMRLMYQLCLQSLKKQTIELKKGSEEEQIFKTLPEEMQK